MIFQTTFDLAVTRLLRFLLGCPHDWKRTNGADERDVPDSYPPTKGLDYISPRRKCTLCLKEEWLVGPEVCGGNRASWVDLPSIAHWKADREDDFDEEAFTGQRYAFFPLEQNARIEDFDLFTYVGPIKELFGKTSILLPFKGVSHWVLAQFDDLEARIGHEDLSHGWHAFRKEEFAGRPRIDSGLSSDLVENILGNDWPRNY